MEKEYQEPKLDIFEFNEDIICASQQENDDDFDDTNWV